MADKEFNVKISAETDDFSSGISKAEDEASILGDTLKSKVTSGTDEATSKIKEMIEELRRLQKEAMGVKNSTSNMNGSFKESSGEVNKFKREMKNLSMMLGGEVPEGTKKAYSELAKLHKEARNASRLYGKYSQQAMNARDAITTFALGLDDTAFKQIYMRSQLGLTDMQLRQQANSIKLNARMTKLMGNQTQILTQRMQGLQKAGVKPEMLLPPSTIGQFQMLNETMEAGGASVSKLSLGYRMLGNRMEKTIKGWSVQKMAIKAANGDMAKYGLLMRGITAGMMNMTMAFPLVGMGALFAYKTMFKAALEADESLKGLADTTKGKVMKALEPLIQTAGQFLEVALKVIGAIADWIAKFNEAHPAIAKVLSVIGFLLPAMTMLLLPIGLGVGLFKGWGIVINQVWTFLGGLVTLIGTASSTFLMIAGIVAVAAGAFLYLWETNEGFRNACITIWEAIKVTIQTALEAIKQFFIEHGDTIKSVLQTAYEILKTIITTVMTAIGEIVKLVLDSVKQFWSEHGEQIMQAVKTVYETIKTLAKNAWEFIKRTIGSVLEVIQSIILAVTSAINGDWDTFWDEVGNIASTIWEYICDIVTSGIQNIPKIISAGISWAANAMKSLWNAAVNAAKSFGSTLINVGKDLIKGMINGVKNMASRLIKSVTGVIGNAIDAAKSLLGINSPSKLFMQFGEWTTEGYEIGIDRGEPSSTRSVENFANNSIEAFATNGLPQEGDLNNTAADNSTYNIKINAGSLNNEQDLYRLAEIIDRKLLEIKERKNKMFGGYQGV